MTELDAHFRGACDGDPDAFARWAAAVELPIRRSLTRFARAVDVEGVVQETLMRMWVYARDRGDELEGDDASLRYALGMARNVARAEARRFGRERYLPPKDLPEPAVAPEPPPDPALRRAIQECLEGVARRPLQALKARIELGHLMPDRELAKGLGMKLNTFFQNVARARKQVEQCLERRGVSVRELIG